MFDVDLSELAVIAVVALIVIGPKDLPKVLRLMGQMTRKAKNLAGEFQKGIDDMVREAELDEMKKKVEAFNQVDFKREVEKAVDPDGAVEKALRIEESPSSPAPDSASAATPAPTPEPPK